MIVLGVNAFHADASAAIICNGSLVAAVEEERFTRIKHWAGFPENAIRYCIESSGVNAAEINVVAINTNPAANRIPKLLFAAKNALDFQFWKKAASIRGAKLDEVRSALSSISVMKDFSGSIAAIEHHHAHVGAAFFTSSFERSALLSIDGMGDFASTMLAVGDRNSIQSLTKVHYPHSLGVFYQAMTQFLGFYNYGDEYKVMGLSPYGNPSFADLLEKVVIRTDLGFRLCQEYFNFKNSSIPSSWSSGYPEFPKLWSRKLEGLLGPSRQGGELTQRHMDIAASVQLVYEKTLWHLLNGLYDAMPFKTENLCLSGGCANNSVANGKVSTNTPFKNLSIHPSAGDSGGALGAAACAYSKNDISKIFRIDIGGSLLGPSFDSDTIERCLDDRKEELQSAGITWVFVNDFDEICQRTVFQLCQGGVVGWFQGRMEWGARSLGSRSLLGDPRRSDMKDILNLKVKLRESFRPFAPSILASEVHEWFETDVSVPHMMEVHSIVETKRSLIPAVTHVDGTGRLQTVTEVDNPRYHRLIESFFAATGVPMVLNTSFNENEPIVCKPSEALDTFLRTNIDLLVMENWVISRS